METGCSIKYTHKHTHTTYLLEIHPFKRTLFKSRTLYTPFMSTCRQIKTVLFLLLNKKRPRTLSRHSDVTLNTSSLRLCVRSQMWTTEEFRRVIGTFRPWWREHVSSFNSGSIQYVTRVSYRFVTPVKNLGLQRLSSRDKKNDMVYRVGSSTTESLFLCLLFLVNKSNHKELSHSLSKRPREYESDF